MCLHSTNSNCWLDNFYKEYTLLEHADLFTKITCIEKFMNFLSSCANHCNITYANNLLNIFSSFLLLLYELQIKESIVPI